MSVPESPVQQLFEFEVPEDKKLGHMNFVPLEVRAAMNGLQAGVHRIQRDRLGYSQFVALGAEELAEAAEEAGKKEVADWVRTYADRRSKTGNYMPEEQRQVVFFPIKAGALVDVHRVE